MGLHKIYDTCHSLVTIIYATCLQGNDDFTHVFPVQSLPFTWSSVFVVVARSVRRRITPHPKRSSISTRRSNWQYWNTTVWMIMAKFTDWDANALPRSVELVSSWLPTLIVNTAESVVWLICSMPWKISKQWNIKNPLLTKRLQFLCHWWLWVLKENHRPIFFRTLQYFRSIPKCSFVYWLK